MRNAKKIAVIVRDRQIDGLRVSCGLTLLDDSVDIIVLDNVLDRQVPEIAALLEVVSELSLHVYSNSPGNCCDTITVEEIAKKLLEYDIVVPY